MKNKKQSVAPQKKDLCIIAELCVSKILTVIIK